MGEIKLATVLLMDKILWTLTFSKVTLLLITLKYLDRFITKFTLRFDFGNTLLRLYNIETTVPFKLVLYFLTIRS